MLSETIIPFLICGGSGGLLDGLVKHIYDHKKLKAFAKKETEISLLKVKIENQRSQLTALKKEARQKEKLINTLELKVVKMRDKLLEASYKQGVMIKEVKPLVGPETIRLFTSDFSDYISSLEKRDTDE